MIKFFCKDNGFTLIEIIVSIALFSIIAIAFFPGIQYSIRNLFISNKFMENNYKIQAEMESFLGTEVTSESAVTTTMNFNWDAGATVPNFTVNGINLSIDSQQNYLDEEFEVFVPTEIP